MDFPFLGWIINGVHIRIALYVGYLPYEPPSMAKKARCSLLGGKNFGMV